MNRRVEAPSSARRRYRDTAFGPVELWRSNGVHGLSADDRHVHVAFAATELTPASVERLREGVRVSLDDEHVLTLVQDVHGLLRRSRVVYVNGVAPGFVPDYAYLRRRRFTHVCLQTDDTVLVRPGGPGPLGYRSLEVAPEVSDDLALVFTVLRTAVGFAV